MKKKFIQKLGFIAKENSNNIFIKNNMNYNLEFISNEDLYNHVKETINKYRYSTTFTEFTKNILDPIKMTFDSSVYGKTIEEVIENEIIRQIDKSNTNHIGYFHQNIFKYIYYHLRLMNDLKILIYKSHIYE